MPIAAPAQFPAAFEPLFTPNPFKVFYGGRGGAKSWNFARALLIMGCQRPIRVLCARELQNSIAESVHKLLSDQNDKLGLGYVVEKAKIYNSLGTEFFFEGIRNNIDKIKSYEGIDICWIEEAQRVTENSFEILEPTIRKKGSEIWISFNPDLETDFIYKRFVKNKSATDIVVKVSFRDNPFFAETEMQQKMEKMREQDFDKYLHVWEGHCKVLLEGAVYADELRDVVKDGRLRNVPYDPQFGVETFWDLGWADSTAIWFAQVVGFEYRLIGYYENNLRKLDHYLEYCQGLPYIYSCFWMPHDAKAKSVGTGRSIQEYMVQKGKPVRIVPKLSLRDGINAARTVFGQCYFDEKRCEAGIKALRHYRYEVVEDGTGQLSREPVHDWSSHGADAFRYLALALRQPRKKNNPAIENKAASQRSFSAYAGQRLGLGWLK